MEPSNQIKHFVGMVAAYRENLCFLQNKAVKIDELQVPQISYIVMGKFWCDEDLI